MLLLMAASLNDQHLIVTQLGCCSVCNASSLLMPSVYENMLFCQLFYASFHILTGTIVLTTGARIKLVWCQRNQTGHVSSICSSGLIKRLRLRATLHVTVLYFAAPALTGHQSLTSALSSFRNDAKFNSNKAGHVTVYMNYKPVHKQHVQNAGTMP